MLDLLRKRSQSTFIQFIVLLITIVFIFWGVGTNMMNRRSSLAVVNGVEISPQDFQRSYERTVDGYRQQFGGTIPQGLLKSLGVKRQVLGKLIRTELLRQGGKEMGVTISKLAAQAKIKDMKAFRQNGIFNMERYKQVLSQNRMTPKTFEASIMGDLITARTSALVYDFANVSANEIQSQLHYDNEKIKLRYVSLRAENFLDKVEVDGNELGKWYEKHKGDYRLEPKIRLQYLLFNYDDLDVAAPTEEELRAVYEQEKHLYKRPEKRRARHILFKVADGKDVELRKEQKKKALEVLARARQGDDFAQLAKTYSEGPTRSQGGDLGFFGSGEMVKSFDEAVFAMKPGDISGVVESPFGFHIIKLEEIRPAMIRPFASVRNEISSRLTKEKARRAAFQHASAAYEDIIRAGSLDKYSLLGKETVHHSDFFPRNDLPATISTDPKFRESIQKLNKGELSLLIELENGYAILYIDDLQQAVIPELPAVRERVVGDYKKEKSVELARRAAEDLLREAKEKGHLAEAAQAAGIATKVTALTNRLASRKSIAPPPLVFQDAFKRPWKESLSNSVVADGDTFFIYEISDRRLAEDQVSGDMKKQLEQRLLVANQNKLLADWISYIESTSKIWINDEMLQ